MLRGILIGLALVAYFVFAIFTASILISVGLVLCLTIVGAPAGIALILAGIKLVFPGG